MHETQNDKRRNPNQIPEDEFDAWKESRLTEEFLFKYLRERREEIVKGYATAMGSGQILTEEEQRFNQGVFSVFDDLLDIEYVDIYPEEDDERERDEPYAGTDGTGDDDTGLH